MSFVDECPTLDQIHDLALQGAKRAESRVLDHVARCRECSAALSGALLAAELSDARPGPSRRLIVALSGAAAAVLVVAIGFSLRVVHRSEDSAASGSRTTLWSSHSRLIQGDGFRFQPLFLMASQDYLPYSRTRGENTTGSDSSLEALTLARSVERNPQATAAELLDAVIFIALEAAAEGRSVTSATTKIASRIPPGAEADFARGVVAWLNGDAAGAAAAFEAARNDVRLGAAALFNAARTSFHARHFDHACRLAEDFLQLSRASADLEPWAAELTEVMKSEGKDPK